MTTELRLNTTVLPGHRIEVASPELPVGATIELVVKVPAQSTIGDGSAMWSLRRFLQALPPGPRSAATWDEVVNNLAEDRQSWDR